MVATLFERLLESFAALLSVPEFFIEYVRQFTGGAAERRHMTARYHTGERIDVC
jgi:hypothetical protein